MNAEPIHAGIRPWFPGPLGRWKWLNEEIPAERMAALRIAVGLVLILDIVGTYLPYFSLFFSSEHFGIPETKAARFTADYSYWSILNVMPLDSGPKILMGVWIASALAFLAGWRPLLSGLVVWACTLSFFNSAPWTTNGGDRLRNVVIITAAVGCCGAVWGVSSVRRGQGSRAVLVPGWPAKMLFLQLAVLYFFSGYYKIISPAWQSGYAMYYVAHELSWGTAPQLGVLAPVWAHKLLSWGTLIWELGFPVLALMSGTRTVTLALGVFFHALTLFTLEVGPFAAYAIAAYAIFIPWERYFGTKEIKERAS